MYGIPPPLNPPPPAIQCLFTRWKTADAQIGSRLEKIKSFTLLAWIGQSTAVHALPTARSLALLIQKQRWRSFWETGWSAYGFFLAHRYRLKQNWFCHPGSFNLISTPTPLQTYCKKWPHYSQSEFYLWSDDSCFALIWSSLLTARWTSINQSMSKTRVLGLSRHSVRIRAELFADSRSLRRHAGWR